GDLPADFDYELDVFTTLNQLPLADNALIAKFAPFYKEWLAHRTSDGYWDSISPNKNYERVHIPALNIGGWYDIFLQNTFENFTGMKARGGTEQVRQNQRVIIGPWS